GVYLQRVGLVQRRPCGRPAITRVAWRTRPGHGSDHPCGLIDTTHAVVRCLCHVEMTLRVKGTHERLAEQRLARWAAVTGIALGSGAGNRLDYVKYECHSLSTISFGPLSPWERAGVRVRGPSLNTMGTLTLTLSRRERGPESICHDRSTPSCSVALTPV